MQTSKQNVIILGLLCFIITGFIVLEQLNGELIKPPTKSKREQTILDENNIRQVINAFYSTYVECIKKPPSNIETDLQAFCIERTSLASDILNDNLTQQPILPDTDRVLCIQDAAKEIQITKIYEIGNNSAKATIREYATTENHSAALNLIRSEDGWKIDNINCSTK